MAENIIELIGINKAFDNVQVLKDISLQVQRNEFVTLLGPSGCGKTTTLNIIGGFEFPDTGDVLFEGASIKKVPPHMRRLNTVFQKYALFPHMNVAENIAFGLKIKETPTEEIKKKTGKILELVNLEGYEKRRVTSLSGGQQQRVAIARALVNEPEVLLLDEPLGALDLKLRKEMQFELKTMQQQLGITFIYVTHDQEEALTMSDKIAVFNKGQIQQIGTPIDIYNEPQNRFVADFIGESNIIDGIMREDYKVSIMGKTFDCVDKGFMKDEPVDVVIRPEDIEVSAINENSKMSGVVNSCVFKGVHYEFFIEQGDYEWMVNSTIAPQVGSNVEFSFAPENIQIMKKSYTDKEA